MKWFILYILAFELNFGILFAAQANYCKPSLCPPDTKHIDCIKNKNFIKSCGPGKQTLSINGTLRDEILHKMNVFRNWIASGTNELFPPAARMPVLKWNPTLAYLAKLLLRQCSKEWQYCANVDKFHFVTSNDITGTMKGAEFDSEMVLKGMIPIWFNDIRGCNMTRRGDIVPKESGKCIGHYAGLVQDNCNFVGCAILTTKNPGGLIVKLLCNFSRGKVKKTSDYLPGKYPGLKCKTGVSKKYVNLCSTKEIIDPNLLKFKSNHTTE